MSIPPDRPSGQLSGGMKVKLALALALAHHPELLILDEPTADMDPVARREFLNIIRDQSVRQGRTTFFSSHLMDEVQRISHLVGIIDRGILRFEGELDDLMARCRKIYVQETSPIPDVCAETQPVETQPVDSEFASSEAASDESTESSHDGAFGRQSATNVLTATPSSPGGQSVERGQIEQAVKSAGLRWVGPDTEDPRMHFYKGTSQAWEQYHAGGHESQTASLEDIFIVLTRHYSGAS